MNVKIYLTIGLGYIIGDVVAEDEFHINMQYVGKVGATQQGVVIAEPIPPWFKDAEAMIRDFDMPTDVIIMCGEAHPELVAAYEQYAQRFKAKSAGLVIAKDLPQNVTPFPRR